MSSVQITELNWSSKQGNLSQAINRIMSLFGNFGLARTPSTVGPDLPTPPLYKNRSQVSDPPKRTTSSGGLGDRSAPSRPKVVSRSTSSISIPFDDGDVDVVRVEGLRHAEGRLEARRYKTLPFAEQLLDILHALRMPMWCDRGITPQTVKIQKVSGSLTNAVFFVSCPTIPHVPIILLRIYGPSSGSLISRPRELRTLHVLSSQYHIGPRVYGTFENGRVEEYFDSTALKAEEMRDSTVSSWIGARMAELHQVDVAAVELETPPSTPPSNPIPAHDIWQIGVKKNVRSWLAVARDVLALPTVSEDLRTAIDLDSFEKEWERYLRWVDEFEAQAGVSPVVFAHNDTQFGNLLKMSHIKPGVPEHRQIIVVDFEYASPNPAAFDVANHFHEWTADYNGPESHILRAERYPTLDQRRNFYAAYLTHYQPSDSGENISSQIPTETLESRMEKLESQVRAWSPASHAMWAIWGIVQAREALEGKDGDPEFDYVGYSRCRMESFRREIRLLAI